MAYAAVKGKNDLIRFDINSDNQAEMSLNTTGLLIGSGQASANLHVQGNALITDSISIGGSNASHSNLHISGTVSHSTTIVTDNLILSDESFVLVDTGTAGGNIRLTLPGANVSSGRMYQIKVIDDSHDVVVRTEAGGLIDIYSDLTYSSNQSNMPSVKLISNGAEWYILSEVGINSTFLPTSTSNLLMWLDADDKNTLYSSYPSNLAESGDNVSRWLDKSGLGNDAIQATSSSQPSLVPSTYDSYRNALYFDDDDGMSTLLALDSAPYTVIAVYNRLEWTQENSRVVTGNNNWLIGAFSGIHRHYAGGWVYNSEDYLGSTTRMVHHGQNIVAIATNNGTTSEFYLDTELVTQDNTQTGVPAGVNLGVSTAYSQPIKGQVCEILIYDKVLSAEEQSSLESYLNNKWQEQKRELICWLDASDATTIYSSYPTTLAGNGDLIDRWTDKSGYGFDAVNSTNTTYYTNIQNSENVVRLGATVNDGMEIYGLSVKKDYTIFIIFNTNSSVATNRRAIEPQFVNWLIGPYQNKIRHYTGNNWVTNNGGDAVTAGTFYLATATSTPSLQKFYVNGVDRTESSPTISSLGGLQLGGIQPLDGDIAELRVYNYSMSDAERSTIEAELTTKWGL